MEYNKHNHILTSACKAPGADILGKAGCKAVAVGKIRMTAEEVVEAVCHSSVGFDFDKAGVDHTEVVDSFVDGMVVARKLDTEAVSLVRDMADRDDLSLRE